MQIKSCVECGEDKTPSLIARCLDCLVAWVTRNSPPPCELEEALMEHEYLGG